jgi:acetolactate synthase-1/2/3 large subunit
VASTTTGKTTVSGSRYLAEAFHASGVTHVFMVPTVAVAALYEMDTLGVQGIMTHGEKTAAYMADGYARASGRVGICMAQTIGAANLAAGLREPRMMGSPVIAMTGGRDPMTKYKHVYQEIEDFPIFETLTKWNAEVDDLRRVPDMVRQAFRAATTGMPGPVHLELRGSAGQVLMGDLEIDLDQSPMSEPQYTSAPAFRPVPPEDALRAALAVLTEAARPVILAGGGTRTSGGQAALLALATRTGIPVATTLTAKGVIDETHPLAVGVVGASSRPSANRAVAEADVVLVVGSQLGSQATDQFRLPGPAARIVQIDIDPEELGRNRPNVVSLFGDARETLAALAALADEGEGREEWQATVAGYVAAFRAEKADLWASDAVPIRPERLCAEVTKALPDDGVLVVDTGHAGIWTAGLIDLKPGQDILRAGGSLGWSFPASLGAKCAVPERAVVCFTGDGGFYYHLGELETAARHGINTVVVINDNVSLSQDMRIFERAFGGEGIPAADRLWAFNDVNLASVAEQFGVLSLRVEQPGEIGDAIETALGAGRPAIVDVRTDVQALPDPPLGGVDFYSN